MNKVEDNPEVIENPALLSLEEAVGAVFVAVEAAPEALL